MHRRSLISAAPLAALGATCAAPATTAPTDLMAHVRAETDAIADHIGADTWMMRSTPTHGEIRFFRIDGDVQTPIAHATF